MSCSNSEFLVFFVLDRQGALRQQRDSATVLLNAEGEPAVLAGSSVQSCGEGRVAAYGTGDVPL